MDVLGARASVAQMVELAQAARSRTGTVSYERQRAILRRLDQYCIAAGYNLNGKVGKWNNAYGAVVEGMLLPTKAVLTKVFYRPQPGDPVIDLQNGIPLNRAGVTLPDGWQVVNSVGIQA